MPFWWFVCGALFILLQLAVINEGLATAFSSPADPAELAALATLVDCPDDVAVTGVLTVGHAADDPAVPVAHLAQRRKPLDELVQWRP